MELAVLLAAGLRDWIDLGVIIGILMLNAIVGWYQEKQAADVVASLKGDIAMRSTVVRNGQEEEIKARELVPGDIVSFTARAQLSHWITINQFARSSSRTDKLSPPTRASSPVTTTPTATKNTSANSKLKLVNLPARRVTMMRWVRSTAPAMLSSPLINLP